MDFVHFCQADLPAGHMSAATPLDDRCPRCGGPFHCGIGDSGPCACTGVTLGADLQAALRDRFEGCLCLACLRALAAGEPVERATTPAAHDFPPEASTPV